MQITVKGKNFEVTEALKSYAEKRISKIGRYFDGIISTDVTLSTVRSWHVVEVTVYANGFVMRGEERTNDMYASIDRVVEKLEKQLKRWKSKYCRKPRSEAEAGVLKSAVRPHEMAGDVVEETGEMESTLEPRIGAVKRFNAKPMSVEEAIMEMEALGFSFFVFLNANENRVNVVYKKPKGYGLIDPILQ